MALKAAVPKAPRQNANIVKQSVTRIPAWFYMNVAAGCVATLIVVLAVRGALFKDDIAVCSDRLSNGVQFGLQDSAGSAISRTDLQSRLAGRDWGLMDNASIVKVANGPAPVALQVNLPKLPKTPIKAAGEIQPKSGMGFTWLMPKLAAATSACLSYDVWLPEDFAFGQGGNLPGLFGGENTDAPSKSGKFAFSVQNGWGENAAAQVFIRSAAEAKGNTIAINSNWLHLKPGRWTRIEQEIILNEPGQENGTLRVWVDGKLQLEKDDMLFRLDSRGTFRGVVADIHYGDNGADFAAVPKSTSLMVTPFVVRWQ
jgi:hypothetical protein